MIGWGDFREIADSRQPARPQLFHLTGRTRHTLPRALQSPGPTRSLHPTHDPYSHPAARAWTPGPCSQFAEM